jgi:hypothetical protein
MGGVVSFLFGGGSSTTKTYQKLGELQRQTAKEAEPRPIIWGRVRPISGNIIHASSVTRKMVEVGRTTTGGKGGGGKKQTQIQYQERAYRTYAIRICEGPITDIVRVWKNDKLVYDARGNEWGDKNNSAFLKYAKFYLGDWDQMPDPVLEAIWGAGNVPAYRGTCYMRVNNEDVTDFGGRVPAYTFEVQRERRTFYLTSLPYESSDVTSEVYTPSDATSRPYAVYDLQSMGTTGGSVENGWTINDRIESVGTSGSVDGGDFNQVVIYSSYSIEPESLGMVGGSVDAGEFGELVMYSEYSIQPESFEMKGGSVNSGSLDEVVGYITYSIEPESFEMKGGSVDSGVFG